MKNKYLFLFSLLVMVFAGCSKESTKQSQTEPEEFYLQNVPQTRSVLYVDSFRTNVLGNIFKEDSLLNFCRVHEFTAINLYTIGPILRSDITVKAQLNDFVGKAHICGLKVNFAAVSSTGVNDIGTYCANYSNKPDGIITEYEFWNNDKQSGLPNSFDTFKTIVNAMTIVHNTYPSISRNAYVSIFKDKKDSNRTSSSIIQYLINNCETIFLVNYYTNAYDLRPLFQTKLHDVTKEAKSLHKVANIIVLFNVHRDTTGPDLTPDIYNYFSTQGHNHPFKHAYNNLMRQYENVVDVNYDGLSMKGYAIFRYSDARAARP